MSRKPLSADKIIDRLRALENKANVSAYIVLGANREHVATIRFSYPRDGAGKLVALAADWTLEVPREAFDRDKWTRWQYGWASGYGYDKHTAALGGMTFGGVTMRDQGKRWDDQLRDAGFFVLQAV